MQAAVVLVRPHAWRANWLGVLLYCWTACITVLLGEGYCCTAALVVLLNCWSNKPSALMDMNASTVTSRLAGLSPVLPYDKSQVLTVAGAVFAAASRLQTELTAYEKFSEPREVDVLRVVPNKKEMGLAFKKVSGTL